MRSLRRCLAAVVAGAGLGACDDGSVYLSPAPKVSMFNAQSITNAEAKVVVIYNHDSVEEAEEDVCDPLGATTPGIVRDLAGKDVRGRKIVVYAFCTSSKVGDYDDRYQEGEPKVVKRTKDIEFLMRDYMKAGLAPDQIFLVGQGAGAWASLLIARRARVQFNALIAFAPAFAVLREDMTHGWSHVLGEHKQFLVRAHQINGLIYAFEDDPYHNTAALQFLGRMPGATFVPLSSRRIGGEECTGKDPHKTAFDDCFRKTQLRVILDFMKRRLDIYRP